MQKKLLLLFIPLSISSCVIEEKPIITTAMRLEIDSIYKKEIVSIRKELDSLCVLQTEQIINEVKDSILQKRLEERKKRLGY